MHAVRWQHFHCLPGSLGHYGGKESTLCLVAASFCSISVCMHAQAANGIEKKTKRKEKTAPVGVNVMKSQVLYRAAQVQMNNCPCTYAGRADEQAHLISRGELLLIGVSLLSSSCQALHIGKRQFHNRLQTCCTVKGIQTAALLEYS